MHNYRTACVLRVLIRSQRCFTLRVLGPAARIIGASLPGAIRVLFRNQPCLHIVQQDLRNVPLAGFLTQMIEMRFYGSAREPHLGSSFANAASFDDGEQNPQLTGCGPTGGLDNYWLHYIAPLFKMATIKWIRSITADGTAAHTVTGSACWFAEGEWQPARKIAKARDGREMFLRVTARTERTKVLQGTMHLRCQPNPKCI